MSFAVLPLTSLATGVTTFTSQNFGAKQFKRIVAGLKQSCLVSITWSVIACVLLYIASPFLAGFISGSDNAVIIDNASRYLRISSLFYPILGMLFIFRNSLQGLGKKLTPLTSIGYSFYGLPWCYPMRTLDLDSHDHSALFCLEETYSTLVYQLDYF